MVQVLGFVFAGASTVTALAMLLLVVWQAPRHRHNRLMAVYLATLVIWGANNLAARLCAVIGCSPTVFMYGNTYFNGLNGLVLFWFVTDYVDIGRRPWVRTVRALGLVWAALGGVAMYAGRILVDATVSPDGLWVYTLSPLSVPTFVLGNGLYLAALGCLWVHRRGGAGALLPGGVVLIAGQLGTLALLPFVQGVPPISIAFTAAASVCFTYAILRENLFNPLARSEASLAALLENTLDPVWAVDARLRLTTFNTAFRQFASALSGSTPESGGDALELLPAEQRPFWRRLYERALHGELVTVERRFEAPGLPTHLEVRFNPIGAPGSPSGVAVFARDITAHARTLAEGARARAAAEDASRAKSQFLASVSHELRTPLNAILGFAQLLAGRGDGPLARQREFVDSILTAGRHLLALINDLIDLSKIEAGKLDLAAARFSIRDQLGAAVRLLASAAQQKHLQVIVEVADGVPDALIGDARRLRQVIVNLIDNAVKFTERGHVLVRVEQEAETYGGVRLRFDVIDTGIGIPPAQRTRLFEPFVHVDRPTGRGQEGVGLGLAITRRLVEAMGGDIRLESEPGSGSTFSFALPFNLAIDAPAHVEADLAGVSVLVVEDDSVLRALIGRWLTDWRARPTLVGSAAEARAALDRARRAGTPFTMLLADAELASGAALSDRSRDPAPAATIVVIFPPSGGGDGEGPAAGHAASVRRPIARHELRAALGAALGGVADDAPAEHRRRSARPLRVLVAEDSLTNQEVAAALLERWGHSVTRVADGRQAVAAVRERPYDLVLMDVQMPGVDGLQATRLIRAGQAAKDRVPIVAMTASATPADRERCLAAGMDAYLTKPVDGDELFETVERVAAPALAGARARRAAGRFPESAGIEAIVGRLDGDRATARTIARAFLDEYPRRVADLRAALASGDAPAMSRAAHALKGSIGQFGATGYDAARRLELIAQEGDLADAPRALRLLEDELGRLLPTLHQLAAG